MLGVGILGSGSVTQSIHLPTLARLTSLFRVAHLMDVDAAVAESVAAPLGANWSTSVTDLLADPGVDVVAICSPSHLHAEQAVAACAAGVKAILCEKPLAETRAQAEAVAAASRDSGVPIIVGAMHVFDPVWLQLRQHWGALPERAHTVRSRIVLPSNLRFLEFAMEFEMPDFGSYVPPPRDLPLEIRNAVLGLAIHDLPLVRRFLGGLRSVDAAEVGPTGGYLISIVGETGCRAQLIASWNAGWKPDWTFDAWSEEAALHIDMPPSYVQAGSGSGSFTTDAGAVVVPERAHNGYEGEWRVLAEIAEGETRHAPDLETLIDDLVFAVDIAEGAAAFVREGSAA